LTVWKIRFIATGIGGAYMSGSLRVSSAAGREGTTRRLGTVRVRGAMPFTSFSCPSVKPTFFAIASKVSPRRGW
jgi:hypothetical protein